MSDEKNIDPTPVPDDLTKTKKPSDIQLNEEELNTTSGGGGAVEYLKVELKNV